MKKEFRKYCSFAIVVTLTAAYINDLSNIKKQHDFSLKGSIYNKSIRANAEKSSTEKYTEIAMEACFNLSVNNDGTKILYGSGDNIYEMNIDGTNKRQLTTLGNCYNAVYNKNNNIIAFARHNGIYTMDIKTNQLRKIIGSDDPNTSYANPNFTGDGQIIYFCATAIENPEGTGYIEKDSGIYKVRLDGTNNTKITNGRNPVLSPNGEMLAFEDSNYINILKLGTNEIIKVAEGKYPSWSHDNRHVSFTKFQKESIPYYKRFSRTKLFIDKDYSNIYIAEVLNVNNIRKVTNEQFNEMNDEIKNWESKVKKSNSEEHFFMYSKMTYFDSGWSKDDKSLYVASFDGDKNMFKLIKIEI